MKGYIDEGILLQFGISIITTVYFDYDRVHDQVMRRSFSGFMFLDILAPVSCSSKI